MSGISVPLSIFGGGGGMPGFSSSSSSGMSQNGAQFGAAGAGDWNVNVAGSGVSAQSASSTPKIPWLWIAGAAVVGYLVLHNK
jgi:hypothetical protein